MRQVDISSCPTEARQGKLSCTEENPRPRIEATSCGILSP